MLLAEKTHQMVRHLWDPLDVHSIAGRHCAEELE